MSEEEKERIINSSKWAEVPLDILEENKKLQQELQLKDKVIDEMVERIDKELTLKDGSCFWHQEREKCEDYDESIDKCSYCIKQYFINKVKGELKNNEI